MSAGVKRKRPVRGGKRGAAAVAVVQPVEETDDAPQTETETVDAVDEGMITAELSQPPPPPDDDGEPAAEDAASSADGEAADAELAAVEERTAADDGESAFQPDASAVSAAPPAAELDRARLKAVVESLIFVSERTVTAAQIARSIKIRAAVVRELVAELMQDYQDRGIDLVEVAGGYQFRSAAACAPFVREFVAQKPVRLTRAQLETLALIAYRQPITRPEIDEVRGVDSGSAMRVLLERELIKMLGRKDEPGRPLLYGTSTHFLEFFGMRSLKDLPTLREFTELSDENRALFKRKTGESVEDAEAELLAAEEAARGETEVEHISDEDLAELAREADDADGELEPARSEPPADPQPEAHAAEGDEQASALDADDDAPYDEDDRDEDDRDEDDRDEDGGDEDDDDLDDEDDDLDDEDDDDIDDDEG